MSADGGTSTVGRLFYVVGPSGAGKDTLLAYARTRLGGDAPIVFAHRYITRPHADATENHVALSDDEFELRLARGCFAMHWRSHGHRYGIGIEINQWLARGLGVVVSGSREHVTVAQERYPDLALVWISAPPELLRARLADRGRESGEAIAARLERALTFNVPLREPDLRLDNVGRSEHAGGKLVEYLRGAIRASTSHL